MTITFYVISALVLFFFSGLLAMAGLGAAFLFLLLFYYMGMPLAEDTPAAFLLNVVNLQFSAVKYWHHKMINLRLGLPMLVTGVIGSPIGAPQFEIRTGHLKSKLSRIGNYGY